MNCAAKSAHEERSLDSLRSTATLTGSQTSLARDDTVKEKNEERSLVAKKTISLARDDREKQKQKAKAKSKSKGEKQRQLAKATARSRGNSNG
jgi:hypothetical protein